MWVLHDPRIVTAEGPIRQGAFVASAVEAPGREQPPLLVTAAEAAEPGYLRTRRATYLGGSGGELLRDMTVDSQGNIYFAGIAGAADFPRTPPEIGGHSRGGGAMVAKFSPAGKLIWSKVIGGLGESSYFYSVKVDKDGSVFVAGRMAVRNLLDELRGGGQITGGPANFSAKDRQAFANQLDRWLTAAKG